MPRQYAFALFAAVLCALAGCSLPAAPPARLDVPLRPHSLADDPDVGAAVAASAVVFVDGAEIVADAPLLTGISTVTLRGDTLTLLSDRGGARYDLAFDGCRIARDGFPSRLSGRSSRLPDALGDVEASASLGDALWIGRDGDDRLLRLNAGRIDRAVTLPGYVACRNAGIEALARLPGGALLAIAEEQRPTGTCSGPDRAAWILDPASTMPPRQVDYASPVGVSPSGATALPDGGVLVLHRRYSHAERTQRLVLARLPAPRLSASVATLEPKVLLDATDALPTATAPTAPHVLDNLEAAEAFTCDGRTYVLLASDDNGRRCAPAGAEVGCQKTLLLLFELP